MSAGYSIRPFVPESDDVEAITSLLHRAYAPLKEQGMWFVASEQDVETTRKRLLYGEPFVAVENVSGRLLGTITLYAPSPDQHCEWYRKSLWHFGQFGVDPCEQGRGIGSALVAQAEEAACALGAREIGLDTAEPAAGLIAFYNRLGYRHVGYTQWGSVSYRSIVLTKSLVAPMTVPAP